MHTFSSSILRDLVFYGTLSTWRSQQVGRQLQPSGHETLQQHRDSLRASIHWLALTPVIYLTNVSRAARRTGRKVSNCHTVSMTGLFDKYSCLGINVTCSAGHCCLLDKNPVLGHSFTALQTGRSQVRFPMVSLEFFIDIILPATIWPWSRICL